MSVVLSSLGGAAGNGGGGAYVGGSADSSSVSSSGGSSRRRKVCCGWDCVKGIGGCEDGCWVEGRSAGGRGGEEENIIVEVPVG